MGKPAPTLLPCGHFSTTTRDGEPACGICLDRAAVERIQAQAEAGRPRPTRGQPAAAPDAVAAAGWPTGERLLGEQPTQGVYDLPDSLYHADPLRVYGTESLSATSHRYLVAPNTPAHYRYKIDHPADKRGAALIFGAAFHAVALGTADLAPFDGASWNSKAGERFLAEHPDHGERLPVLARDVPTIEAMAASLHQHPLARRALSNGAAEQALFGQHPDLGVWLRCKVDYLANAVGDRLIITDLKTTECAHESEFAASAGKYGYDLQADNSAYLARLLRLAKRVTMLFVAVESHPPYLVNAHEIEGDDLRQARALNEAAERTFARCLESGDWPGYPARINRISMPAWVARDRESALLDILEGEDKL